MSAGDVTEALALLCSSDRVIEDLEKTIAYMMATSEITSTSASAELDEAISESLTSSAADRDMALQDLKLNPLCLVFRPFVPIPRWAELRAFVCGGRMTALSQYFADESFPILVKYKSDISSHVWAWFNAKVHPALVIGLNYRHVVLDIALIRKLDSVRSEILASKKYSSSDYYGEEPSLSVRDLAKAGGEGEEGDLIINGCPMQAVLIELNSFGIRSGGSLFDWDEDYSVLMGVACDDPSKPPEFRVRDEN